MADANEPLLPIWGPPAKREWLMRPRPKPGESRPASMLQEVPASHPLLKAVDRLIGKQEPIEERIAEVFHHAR